MMNQSNSTINDAIQNTISINYTNSSFIKEQELLQQLKDIYTNNPTVSLNKEIINNLINSLTQLKTPYRDSLNKIQTSLRNYYSNQTQETFQRRDFSSLRPSASSQSPFQITLLQLSDTDQKQFIIKNQLIQLFIHIIRISFILLITSQDVRTSYSIRRFLSQYGNLFNENNCKILIRLFIFNNGTDLRSFRRMIYNSIRDNKLIRFCFSEIKSYESIIYSLFRTIIGVQEEYQFSNQRIQLYLRYINQFLQAPYYDSYKENKASRNLTQVLGMDINIYCNHTLIQEFRRHQPDIISRRFGFTGMN